MSSYIRKISIGTQPKGNSMHYFLGQKVSDKYTVSSIIEVPTEVGRRHDIYVKDESGVEMKWKEVNEYLPKILEYNLEFT